MEEDNVVEPTEDVMKVNLDPTMPDMGTVSSDSSDTPGLKLQRIISVVKTNHVAADLKWSLFVSACQSYKQDFCVRPFPPFFLKDGNKDFQALSEAVDSVPALTQVNISLPEAAVNLLHWVLVDLKEPTLSVVDKSQIDATLELVGSEMTGPSPSLVVRLSYDVDSAKEKRWQESKETHGTVYAFHGSKTINFHSILHHGLQQHLTTNALFGQGVYLSSELLVCLPYSKTGLGWRHSLIGDKLSMVALCEVADHPSVHCFSEEDRERARASDSQNGDVPDKFYVVTNSDLIRVRYLLVWAMESPPVKNLKVESTLTTWFRRNKMVVSLTAYAVLLVAIGLSRSPTFWRMWRDLSRTFNSRF